MIQTQENGEKPHFGPDLGPPIRPKIGPPKLLQYFYVSCDFVCKDDFLDMAHCQVSDSYYSLYKAKGIKDVVFPNYMP